MTTEPLVLRFDSIRIDNSAIDPVALIEAQAWINSKIAATPGAEFLTVTPAMAFAMLMNNSNNRNISDKNLGDIRRAILNGTFQPNGESIVLCDTGELNDGQHRLIAIVQTNMPITTLVAWGMPRESRMTVDIGRKRTNAGFLAMRGVKYSNLTSGVVSGLWQYERYNTVDSTVNLPSSNEAMMFYQQKQAEIDSVVGKISSKEANAIGGQSLLTLAFLLFRRKDPQAAAEFMDLWINGAGLDRDNPILSARQRLIKDFGSTKKLRRGEKMEIIMRTWNMWRMNQNSTKSVPVTGNLPSLSR